MQCCLVVQNLAMLVAVHSVGLVGGNSAGAGIVRVAGNSAASQEVAAASLTRTKKNVYTLRLDFIDSLDLLDLQVCCLRCIVWKLLLLPVWELLVQYLYFLY